MNYMPVSKYTNPIDPMSLAYPSFFQSCVFKLNPSFTYSEIEDNPNWSLHQLKNAMQGQPWDMRWCIRKNACYKVGTYQLYMGLWGPYKWQLGWNISTYRSYNSIYN